MNELFKRLSAETPSFFRKIRNMGISFAAIGGSMAAIPGVPETVTQYTNPLLWIGPVMVVIAQSVVKDPEVLQK